MAIIYLDYASTTPISKRVAKAMCKNINDENLFGNSSSATHVLGKISADIVAESRQKIAQTLDVKPSEIILTSGATESDNLAIKGIAEAYKHKGKHIITSKIEHSAVLGCCEYLETQGFDVSYLIPNKYGEISLNSVKNSLREDTILISLMSVNNELGSINPIQEIGALAKAKNIVFHVDAAQGYGKVAIDIQKMNIDLLSISAHKIYGPKGIGFLYVRSHRPHIKLAPQVHGGLQEYKVRSGTLANHQIIGMAAACVEIFENFDIQYQHTNTMRDYFLEKIIKIKNIQINTNLKNSYAGLLNITFNGVNTESLMAYLENICISAGSACSSDSIEPSHVLVAIGLSPSQASSSLRFSFGRYTTFAAIDIAVEKLIEYVDLLRTISPQGANNV